MIRRSLMVLSRGVGVANSVEEGSMLSSMTFFTINNQIHDNNKLMTTLANLEYLNVKIFILIINPYFPRFKHTSTLRHSQNIVCFPQSFPFTHHFPKSSLSLPTTSFSSKKVLKLASAFSSFQTENCTPHSRRYLPVCGF